MYNYFISHQIWSFFVYLSFEIHTTIIISLIINEILLFHYKLCHRVTCLPRIVLGLVQINIMSSYFQYKGKINVQAPLFMTTVYALQICMYVHAVSLSGRRNIVCHAHNYNLLYCRRKARLSTDCLGGAFWLLIMTVDSDLGE